HGAHVSAVYIWFLFIFFFQAEDGIRDRTVTGVQTCALPIFPRAAAHHSADASAAARGTPTGRRARAPTASHGSAHRTRPAMMETCPTRAAAALRGSRYSVAG